MKGGKMGTKRVIDIDLWTDELVETFTPEERYFWMFLLTNPFTTQCGIYHITQKQMCFYLGYENDVVSKLLKRFEKDYQLIKYVNNEIAIKNYMIHSIVKGGLPIEELIKRELGKVKSKSLINWVFECLNSKKDSLKQTIINILNNKDLYINVNANVNACTQGRTLDCTHERTRFTKPTIEELNQYCKEKGYSIDTERFFNYYESKGWLIGKAPMKSWKAALTNWSKNDFNNKPTKKQPRMEEIDF